MGVVLQYISLKDKIGKEIYESDILVINGQDRMVVEWMPGTFTVGGRKTILSAYGWTTVEVIGNIYEQHLIGSENENNK